MVLTTIDEFGRLDVLTHVATMVRPTLLEDATPSEWEQAFRVDAWGPAFPSPAEPVSREVACRPFLQARPSRGGRGGPTPPQRFAQPDPLVVRRVAIPAAALVPAGGARRHGVDDALKVVQGGELDDG